LAQAILAAFFLQKLQVLERCLALSKFTNMPPNQRRNVGCLARLMLLALTAVSFQPSLLFSLVQPKRPQSSYMLWLKDNRESIAKKLGTNSVTMVAKEAGKLWHKLPKESSAKYVAQAEKAKKMYTAELKQFIDQGGVLKKRARKDPMAAKKKKKDPNAPKRPLSAYMRWLGDNRAKITKSLGPEAKVTEIAKEAGARWKRVKKTTKGKYQAAYEKDWPAYKKALAEYQKAEVEA